jgi:medium-chain acyl-[acyl-carrier-protein] hydrolase
MRQNNSILTFTNKNQLKSKVRLFCFPYSGANATIYSSWADSLPGSIEICAIQYPGHGNRIGDRLRYHVDDLIESILPDVTTRLDIPYAFFGHSLGALVGYEISKKLPTQGSLVHVFVSAHRAPQIPDPNPTLHNLDDLTFLDRIVKLGGMEKELIQSKELVEIILPILKADFTICENYQFQDKYILDCPVSVFGGLEDLYISRNDLLAWKELTSRAFSLRMFPGDHFFIRKSQYYILQVIARELNQFLE